MKRLTPLSCLRPALAAAAISATLLLAACGKPVPPDKAAYVGHWTGPQMTLSITQDGKVHYERRDGGASKSLDAPLQGFQGDNFEVGLAGMTTTFVVTQPPHAEGDATKMTVDGVVLTKEP